MADTRIWITAIVALIVGAVIGYFVTQGQVSDLQARLSAAETELMQANETAGTMAAEAEELSARNQELMEENQALMEENETLRGELEAAAQPAPEPAEEVEEAGEVDEAEEEEE